MGEKKIFDLAVAAKDEGVDIALSEILPELVKNYGDLVVPEAVAGITGGLVGAVCPRLNNIWLSYKQNRLERNVGMAIEKLYANQQTLANRVTTLEQSSDGRKMVQMSEELLLDNIVDEIQPQKVQYSVNGFVNLLNTENANMDMAVMFFKTIAELNDLDIRILRTYDYRHREEITPITPFNSEYDYSQLRMIREKLSRLGLLQSKNEELSTENLDLVMQYLKDVEKANKKKNSKMVNAPRFKKLRSSDTYKVTSLGMTLLNLISDDCNLQDIAAPEGDEDIIEE